MEWKSLGAGKTIVNRQPCFASYPYVMTAAKCSRCPWRRARRLEPVVAGTRGRECCRDHGAARVRLLRPGSLTVRDDKQPSKEVSASRHASGFASLAAPTRSIRARLARRFEPFVRGDRCGRACRRDRGARRGRVRIAFLCARAAPSSLLGRTATRGAASVATPPGHLVANADYAAKWPVNTTPSGRIWPLVTRQLPDVPSSRRYPLS
jgi:hypothetical protein